MGKLLMTLCVLFLIGCQEPGVALAQASDSGTNVVFVVDTSGSMDGDKMQQTKSALSRSIALLPDHANVGILLFDDDLTWIFPIGKLDRRNVESQVDRIYAGGGTAIGRALEEASRALTEHKGRLPRTLSEAVFQIVLMTDGSNTNGTHPMLVIPQVSRTGQRLDIVGIEFYDDGIKQALAQSGFKQAYHEAHQVGELFRVLKKILKLEEVSMGTGGARDASILLGFDAEILRALLQAVVTAERKMH